jgi:hypothetical protein
MSSLSEPPPHIFTENVAPTTSPARPVDPALFLNSRKCRYAPCVKSPQFNAPTRHLGRFQPVFPRTDRPRFGQTSPPPVPRPADGVLVSEPIWERPAGPKTHSRRTGRKLGQTRRARQGLVRVPESNTKYGGKGGITGGDAAPVMDPSISESSGIPKGKKLFRRVERRLHPLFTGQVFFQPQGLRWRDSP